MGDYTLTLGTLHHIYIHIYTHPAESTGSEAKPICLQAGPRAIRMAQWVKTLASKTDAQTHRVQGKNPLL